jgi:hypothetical protein
MMSDKTGDDRGAVLTEEQVRNDMGENVTVEGDAVPGHRVEIEYSASSGGAWRTSSPSTISGELLYVEKYGSDSHQMVVRDEDSGRSVRFTTSGRRSLKSLAARKTKRGRSLGTIITLRFTDEDLSALAPVMNVLRRVIPGDTVCVDGTEYGVVSTTAYGPERARDKYSAVLTTPDGEEYVLEASAAYSTASATFSPRWGDDEDVDPSAVSVGRFRERYFDSDNEGLDTEDTTDAFPAPHYAREGERVTLTLTGEDTREDHPEERVSGEVTDVRYFRQKKTSWVSGPDEVDPQTTVELDDGRKVNLQNASRRGSSHVTRSRREEMGEGGMVRAHVVTYREDADNEYAHVEAVDIQREGADTDVETDGGSPEVLTDGGEPVREGPTPAEKRDPIPPADFVADLSEPVEDADGYAKLDIDERDHRLGGFWFPAREGAVDAYVDITDLVFTKEDIPMGDLIHYPKDDRPPEMTGGRDVPEWVNPRHVDATLGPLGLDEEPEPEPEPEPRGEVDGIRCDVCGNPAFSGGVTGEDYPEGKGLLACSDCLETEPEGDAGEDPEVMTDGGEDLDALASAVSRAIASSDLAMNAVSVHVDEVNGAVTVQGNGAMSREDWTELREDITAALDGEGFQYSAEPQMAFVEVTGREVRADGGVVREDPDSREDTPAAIALDAVFDVVGGSPLGESLTFVPHGRTCAIRYSGAIGSVIANRLDDHVERVEQYIRERWDPDWNSRERVSGQMGDGDE